MLEPSLLFTALCVPDDSLSLLVLVTFVFDTESDGKAKIFELSKQLI